MASCQIKGCGSDFTKQYWVNVTAKKLDTDVELILERIYVFVCLEHGKQAGWEK